MKPVREKRNVQRIRPDYPVVGQLPAGNVIVADLSTMGARVEHQFPLAAGRRVRLDFSCEGESLSVLCDVVRCKLQKCTSTGGVVYSSGLCFCDLPPNTASALRRVIAAFVTRAIEQRRSERATATEITAQAV